MFGMPGWVELLIVFAIILLLFGASRLPKIARSMGESVGEFKDGLKEGREESDSEDQNEKLDEETESDVTQ
ncbi:MAG: twin-arginine translocase TatA/TatE family subunit [bacterium]